MPAPGPDSTASHDDAGERRRRAQRLRHVHGRPPRRWLRKIGHIALGDTGLVIAVVVVIGIAVVLLARALLGG